MLLLQSTMGWTRVRFLASVKASARVRLRVTLMDMEQEEEASSPGFGQATADRGRSSRPAREPEKSGCGRSRAIAARGARRSDILSPVVVSSGREPTEVWCRVAADRRRECTHIRYTSQGGEHGNAVVPRYDQGVRNWPRRS